MDIRHFYLEKGQGAPLLLLHGNGEDSGYFARQMDAFAAHFHVYALDTRGHGQTARGNAPFTIRQFAEDLWDFLDAQGLARVHVLGFSDGGNIALIFALRHPERVDRLILNGANLNAGGVRRRTQIPIEIGYRFARLFAARSEKARAEAELLGLMVHDPNIAEEELGRVQAKTLVLAGTRDMIRRSHTEHIAANIPGAQLVFLEGSHFIARENPEAFNRCVLDFLTE